MKYFLKLDGNRIITRYKAKEAKSELDLEVSESVFKSSIKNNHNTINLGVTSFVDYTSDKEKEKNRLFLIKRKAESLILETYPEYKQRNILMSQDAEAIGEMNDFIKNIRNISNQAEIDGIALEDIVWN